MVDFEELKHKTNYLSVDKKIAISSYGEIFEVGEEVGHESNELELAVINSFATNEVDNKIIVYTDRGAASLDFLRKV